MRAYVCGHFDADGWGQTGGYPAVKLDPDGPHISGYIFSSADLPDHWERLDKFEGEAYERRKTTAYANPDKSYRVHIYILRKAE